MKHIDIRAAWVRLLRLRNQFKLVHVAGDANKADFFTHVASNLGVREIVHHVGHRLAFGLGFAFVKGVASRLRLGSEKIHQRFGWNRGATGPSAANFCSTCDVSESLALAR